MPTIGIIAALADYAQLSPALADEGRTLMLDERSAVAAMRDGQIDLLLVAPRSDWWAEMPGIVDLKSEAQRAFVTVVAMVPRGDAAALTLAFDSGVADCIPYPFDVHEVAVRTRALLRRKRSADRQRTEAAEAHRLALTDVVTGLWNRRHLDADLAAKVGHAHAAARPLSLLMIDIDGFKATNDRHGHAIGDKVLRQVAECIGSGIRGGDTLARYGGDEIVLIMPETTIGIALSVAERLRALVADTPTEIPFGITISIGIAELSFDEPASMLLAKADKALYAAKLDGRNRVAAAS